MSSPAAFFLRFEVALGVRATSPSALSSPAPSEIAASFFLIARQALAADPWLVIPAILANFAYWICAHC